MRTLMSILLIAVAGSWLAACNTAEGVGKDVKATGNAIEETAKETKKKL